MRRYNMIPTMKHAYERAEARHKVIDLLPRYAVRVSGAHSMSTHHQHIMLNHALWMRLS